jgi:hypothetical protein
MEERPSEGNMLTSWQPGSKQEKEECCDGRFLFLSLVFYPHPLLFGWCWLILSKSTLADTQRCALLIS